MCVLDTSNHVFGKCSCLCLGLQDESLGFGTGRGKKLFVCTSCNNLEGRIRRLTEGAAISKLWRDMDSEEKIAWRAENSALAGHALKERLSVTFTQKILAEDETKAGSLGEYLPLSVYKARGYDAQFLKHIEQTANSRMEGNIKLYALRVFYEGDEKRHLQIEESLWKPLDGEASDIAGEGGKKRKRVSSSSSSCSLSSSSSKVRRNKKRKRKDKAEKDDNAKRSK